MSEKIEGIGSSDTGKDVVVKERKQRSLASYQKLEDPIVEQFCRDCVVMLPIRAYRRAYPEKVKTLSREGIRQLAYSLSKRHDDRIRELKQEYLERYDCGADNVLGELAAIAFASLPDIVNVENGEMTLRDFESLTEEQRRSIRKVRFVQSETKHGPKLMVEYELWDKVKALELLARHNRILGEDTAGAGRHIQIYMDMRGAGAGPPAAMPTVRDLMQADLPPIEIVAEPEPDQEG